jgi:PilZ domain
VIERRQESRTAIDLELEVWGTDTRGDPFQQIAHARDISLSGALLSLDAKLRSGDLIGILYAGKKARYRVVWVSRSGADQKMQAAVQRIAADECPWQDLLPESPVAKIAPEKANLLSAELNNGT